MVKLTCVAILKYNGPEKDPFIIGMEADLSSFGFFQRSTVKEMLTFVARTVGRKTQIGQRQTVQQEEYFCHVQNRDGLVGVAFVDHDYPARAGFSVVGKILDDYLLQSGNSWRGVVADSQDAQPILTSALQKYQASLLSYRILFVTVTVCYRSFVEFADQHTFKEDDRLHIIINGSASCRILPKLINCLKSREILTKQRSYCIKRSKVFWIEEKSWTKYVVFCI